LLDAEVVYKLQRIIY